LDLHPSPAAPARVVRVLPDVPAIDREFAYLVPDRLGERVGVGSVVRFDLHGRRVSGWVTADGVSPPDGVALRPLARVTGHGPPAEMVELAAWAAWRWAGRRASFLKAASPDGAVRSLPAARLSTGAPSGGLAPSAGGVDDAFADPGARTLLRVPPAEDLLPVVLAAAGRGPSLVVVPATGAAAVLAGRLRRAGVPVALLPAGWAQASAGAQVVIGARAAAWAPCPELAAVVVLDGHDEALQQQQAPTWNGWVVAAERARRSGVPCVVASAAPTLELLAWGTLKVPERNVERAGWAALEVVDRRRDDPRLGLYSARLVGLLRGPGRVVCVLNRKGRFRLLACGACGEVVRCEVCGGATAQASAGQPPPLVCGRCRSTRPPVCHHCGSTALSGLRPGVTRVRAELEALAGRPVGEVTAETGELPGAAVLVGTEAVLHRVGPVDGVAFLDFDQELLAPRFRAGEESLALLARASRLVGGRHRRGRVLVQTRVPHHEVLVAAVHADPGRLAESEARVRGALGLPPERAMAAVSGPAASAYVEGLKAAAGLGVDIAGPDCGRWLVRAPDHDALSSLLAAVDRPAGRLRVAVDPLRV
jgi:primosomal protein N' (replication factor Y)